MKFFNMSTEFESNTHYCYDSDRLCCHLSDTTRLEDKIYRSIYTSPKTWLDTAIYLKGLSNVTLDFGGATLFLKDDTIQPFVLDECENITIKNVIIEYERSLLNEMCISAIKDGEIRCTQTEKQKRHFPMRAENGCLIPIIGKKEYPDAFKGTLFLNLYDTDTRECVRMYLVRIGTDLPYISKESFPFSYTVLTAEQKNEHIILRGQIPADTLSNVTCAITHSKRDISSCFIIRSKNTVLENVRILNGAGMGILGMYSENIRLDGVKYSFDARSHGITTNAADALHLVACYGNVEILNSVFEGMKDDALNIHSSYYTVQSVEGNVIHAKLNTDIQANPHINAHYKIFGEGDRIALYQGSTTIQKQTLSTEHVEITGDFTVDLFVTGDTSYLCAGDTIENLSAQPNVYIKSCRFGKAKTNLRLQTRGKIWMEDCECSLTILLSGDKNYWYESSPVNDLTIKNCRFTGEHALVRAVPEFDVTSDAPYYHSGIRVIQNCFDTTNALQLAYCDHILFEGNTNSNGLLFENIYQSCTNITEK